MVESWVHDSLDILTTYLELRPCRSADSRSVSILSFFDGSTRGEAHRAAHSSN